jgi:hypothetical protein
VGAPAVLLEGGRGGQRHHARRYLPLPSIEAPEIFVPLGLREAARYALMTWLAPRGRARALRNDIVARLAARDALPAVRPLVTVIASAPHVPFFVAAARGLGIEAEQWFLTTGRGDALSRGVFHLFGRGAAEPHAAVKFARVAGYSAPFDADERGLHLAASTGPVVAEHAPRFLGRTTVEGVHASVETAAVGQSLLSFLHARASREAKLAAIERVCAWLVRVAAETRVPPEGLRDERARLERDVLAAWVPRGAPPDLVASVADVPGAFQHLDVGTWNIVVGDGRFTVLDWEDAKLHGLPLWDVVYFLADALAHLDGAETADARASHFRQLFAGELPASSILFDAVRRAAAASGVAAARVGAVVTLCWLDAGLSRRKREAALREHVGGADALATPWEDLAGRWLRDPGLGPGWSARR